MRYERDEDGTVVGEVHTTEPEWDDEQRGWMLALAAYEDDLCDGCGQPLQESMSPETDDGYIARAVGRCHACDAIGAASEARENTVRPHLLRWRVTRKDA